MACWQICRHRLEGCLNESDRPDWCKLYRMVCPAGHDEYHCYQCAELNIRYFAAINVGKLDTEGKA